MMNKPILLIAISILFLNCTNLKYLTPFDGYKGIPKIVETEVYTIKKDSIKELSSVDVFHFDKKGRMIKWLDYYGQERKPAGAWHYKYDKKGNIIEFSNSEPDGTVGHSIHYGYNKYGQLLTEESPTVLKKYTYDRKNRTAELKSFYKNGKFHDLAIYRFNKNWQRIELVTYNESGEITLIHKSEYDENGNAIKESRFRDKNKLNSFSKSNFDIHNNRTDSKAYEIINSDTALVRINKWSYSYDSYNNIIEEKVISDNRTTKITQNKITY